MEDIEQLFTGIGGEFLTFPALITEKLKNTRVYLFDWDGVFNSGTKGDSAGSLYTEADVMGVNMLRFCHYLQYRQLPYTAVVSGMDNPAAFHFANREHLQAVYFGIKNKKEALQHIFEQQEIAPQEISFVFDDILDLPIARECGLGFLIRKDASPLFKQYVQQYGCCDYVTGQPGGAHAVREVCELILGLKGMYKQTIEARIANSQAYRTYLSERNSAAPRYFTSRDNAVVEAEAVS